MMIIRIANKPPRLHQDHALYFVTFCTYKRNAYLHQGQVPEMLIENLIFYCQRLRELMAYTIMPDHMHLIVEVEKSGDLSNFLRDFKKHTSKEIKKLLNLNEEFIWQRGSFDHSVRFSWTGHDLQNHVNYLFLNSWKHLQIAPADFPYHNFQAIIKRGWLEDDVCSFNEKVLKHGGLYE
jgi:REP element-mobilizing transposase RayT